MKAYQLAYADYPKSSWAIHEVTKPVRRRKNPDMAPVFYKFFSTPDAEVNIYEPYREIQCPECGLFDSDEVFKIGFPSPPTIRFSHDIGLTDDRIHVINDKCLAALEAAGVAGYETKPLADSGWHALHITTRVAADKKLISHSKEKCPVCGRPDNSTLHIHDLSQISVPAHENTFFTTEAGSPSTYLCDRSIFFTEGVYSALKAGKIKGPYADRLFTPAEREKLDSHMAAGKSWRPPGSTVYLSGK